MADVIKESEEKSTFSKKIEINTVGDEDPQRLFEWAKKYISETVDKEDPVELRNWAETGIPLPNVDSEEEFRKWLAIYINVPIEGIQDLPNIKYIVDPKLKWQACLDATHDQYLSWGKYGTPEYFKEDAVTDVIRRYCKNVRKVQITV